MKTNIQCKSDGRYGQLERLDFFDLDKLSGKRVLVVGSGAIGNYILQHLALNFIPNIIVVDFDVLELSNLARAPLFAMADVGLLKAKAAKAKLQVLNPDVRIDAYPCDIQNIGQGIVASSDIIIGAVDSILARMHINTLSMRYRIPYIDCGAQGEGLIGVVKVFNPSGKESTCLQCGWDQEYHHLGLRMPCDSNGNTRPSGEPTISSVTALSACVASNEALKQLLEMDDKCEAPGTEIRHDLMFNTLTKTKLKPSINCLIDHDYYIENPELLEKSVHGMSLGELFAIAQSATGPDPRLNFHRDFAIRLICSCGRTRNILKVASMLTDKDTVCECSLQMQPQKFRGTLTKELGADYMGASLASLGIPDHDIVVVTGGNNGAAQQVFFEFPSMKEHA